MDPNDRAAPSSAAHAPSTRVRPVLERLIATTRRHSGRLSQRSEVQLRDYGGAAFEDRLQERLAPHQRAQGLRFEDTLAPAGRCERVPEDGMLIWIELEGPDAIRHRGDGSTVDELRALVCERVSAYMEGSGDPIGSRRGLFPRRRHECDDPADARRGGDASCTAPRKRPRLPQPASRCRIRHSAVCDNIDGTELGAPRRGPF